MILDSKKTYGRFIGQPIYAKDLFGNLPSATRKNLALIQERKKINGGETIMEIGSFPENIYVLQKGKTRMSFYNDLSKNIYFRLIEKNEIIGLTQSVSEAPSELSVKTITACLFDVFPTKDFFNFLKSEPQVCFRLVNQLSLDIESNYKTFSSMIF